MSDALRVALVGNPNCGKTVIQPPDRNTPKVANYAGVTVERKVGHFQLPSGRNVRVLICQEPIAYKPPVPMKSPVMSVRAKLLEEGQQDAFLCGGCNQP